VSEPGFKKAVVSVCLYVSVSDILKPGQQMKRMAANMTIKTRRLHIDIVFIFPPPYIFVRIIS